MLKTIIAALGLAFAVSAAAPTAISTSPTTKGKACCSMPCCQNCGGAKTCCCGGACCN